MKPLANLFKKSAPAAQKGGMEDFMTLLRVYFQASLAAEIGINSLAILPDLRLFKTTLHVPTQNNKLGVAERNHCRRMMKEIYKTDDRFFKEIDQSIRKNCRRLQEVQPYLVQFQGFSQDIMMLLGNLMRFRLRLPAFFKGAIRAMTEKTVTEILTKNDFSNAEVQRTAGAIRQYNKRLSFSKEWIVAYVYQVVMLAKKEPKHRDNAGK